MQEPIKPFQRRKDELSISPDGLLWGDGRLQICADELAYFSNHHLVEAQSPKAGFLGHIELEVEVTKPGYPFSSPLEESLSWDIYSSYVLLQSPEESVAEVGVEPEAEEDKEVMETTTEDPLACYTIDDVKSVLGHVTGEVLGNFQTEINEKLHKQEEAYTVRISKLKMQ
uniref:ciliary-associated calcium-binding coiled-coil protein 1 n=1 Tax=Pristiophorus japonicus TaxID=55135 RepID=UPI00398E96C1